MQRPSSHVRESAKTDASMRGLRNEDGGGEDHRGQRHPDRQRIEAVAGVGHPLAEQDVAGPHRRGHQREQHAGQVGVELHAGQQQHARRGERRRRRSPVVGVSPAPPPPSVRGTRWRPRCRAGSAKSPRRWRCSWRSSRGRTSTRRRLADELHRAATAAATPRSATAAAAARSHATVAGSVVSNRNTPMAAPTYCEMAPTTKTIGIDHPGSSD